MNRINQEIITNCPDETVDTGKQLVSLLETGDLVSLTGPLGAGKTCLIKGIALGLGVAEREIKSPSYTLVNEYYGNSALFHFDLFRLKNSDELYGIGWDDYLMREGITVVEWGEKADRYLPEKRIQISIFIISDNRRRLEFIFLNN